MFFVDNISHEFLVTHVFRSDKAVKRENIQQRQLPVRRKTCVQVFENQFQLYMCLKINLTLQVFENQFNFTAENQFQLYSCI
jgi:hypothetical protein